MSGAVQPNVLGHGRYFGERRENLFGNRGIMGVIFPGDPIGHAIGLPGDPLRNAIAPEIKPPPPPSTNDGTTTRSQGDVESDNKAKLAAAASAGVDANGDPAKPLLGS